MKTNHHSLSAAVAGGLLLMTTGIPPAGAEEPKPTETDYFIPPRSDGSTNPNPFLASGVGVGKNVAIYYTAGTGPGSFSACGPTGDPTRYIDPELFPGCELPDGVTITEAQGLNALKRVQQNLEAQGLGLEDVIFLRIYLEAPPGEDRADYNGWNRAYRKFFANVDLVTGEVVPQYLPVELENPTRPARSNLEVATLPVLGWLVELEAIAAYPKK
jgi:enamine deaminase RidA (YjgF/YER057c/UK114 family)